MNAMLAARAGVILTTLTLSTTASAGLGTGSSGIALHVGGGLGLGDGPMTPGVGWTAGIGGWFGKYDDAFSLGRHVGVGINVRQDVQLHQARSGLRTSTMLQVHRGIDLLVVGLQVGGAIGPYLNTPTGGPTQLGGVSARVIGVAKYRFKPRWGLFLRLEGGADVALANTPDPARVFGTAGALVGLEFAMPVKR